MDKGLELSPSLVEADARDQNAFNPGTGVEAGD
jgi:hypothetical protein